MGQDDLKKALLDILLGPEVLGVLQEKLIDPAIEKAVRKAEEAKDREISILKEELKTTKQTNSNSIAGATV